MNVIIAVSSKGDVNKFILASDVTLSKEELSVIRELSKLNKIIKTRVAHVKGIKKEFGPEMIVYTTIHSTKSLNNKKTQLKLLQLVKKYGWKTYYLSWINRHKVVLTEAGEKIIEVINSKKFPTTIDDDFGLINDNSKHIIPVTSDDLLQDAEDYYLSHFSKKFITKQLANNGEELANQHSQYITALLNQYEDANILDKIIFHYKTAFIHGYKHGIEDTLHFLKKGEEYGR